MSEQRDEQTFPMAVPAARIEHLRMLAEARGVDPAALMQQWVIERLDVEPKLETPPVPEGTAGRIRTSIPRA